MANIRQVADKVGVSIGTVSRALNNKPGVGEKAREHVLIVAQELGYLLPRLFARNSPEVTHLGFLSSFRSITTNPFYADVFHGAEQTCQELHINLSGSSLTIESHHLQRIPRLVRENHINGPVYHAAYYHYLRRSGHDGADCGAVIAGSYQNPWPVGD